MPALYAALDVVAIRVQRLYFRLLAWDLMSLLLAGAISSVDTPTEFQQIIHVATALLFAISLVLTVVLAKKSYQRAWYRARAAAESVKTLAWRYVAAAPPYPLSEQHAAIDARFVEDLKGILQAAEDTALQLAAEAATGPQITDSMRGLRAGTWEVRKNTYLADRVGNQRRWYSQQAKRNEERGSFWFAGMMVGQALALLSAILQGVLPSVPINVGSVLAAVAAACMAWLQSKDFEELAQAYTITAHELGLIAVQGEHIDGDESLARFVASAEGAVSREHTFWLAKRDRRIG